MNKLVHDSGPITSAEHQMSGNSLLLLVDDFPTIAPCTRPSAPVQRSRAMYRRLSRLCLQKNQKWTTELPMRNVLLV
jgi:hypothetical protein